MKMTESKIFSPVCSRARCCYGIGLAALAMILSNFGGSAQPDNNRRAIRNIQYIEDGSNFHQLDLYLPSKGSFDEKRGAPLVVWVHGGGWKGGDKVVVPVGRIFPNAYALATINYRLTTDEKAVFPAQIEDCKAAIRFLRKHAAEYGIDPKRVAACGSSAGGHLVLLLALTGDDQFKSKEYPSESSQVQAVCDWSGPTDFLTISEQAGSQDQLSTRSPHGPVASLLGGTIEERKDLARQASPITYVKGKCPPILILNGALDHVVPLEQSQEIFKALKNAHANVQLVTLPDAGHNLAGAEAFAKTKQFVDEYMK